MANVLCLDFDDTVTLENLTRLTFERFAAPQWRDLEAAYHRGEYSVEEYNALAFDLIEPDVSLDEMRAFALETARVREGFVDLVGWTSWHDWQVAVVSNGFDFYVDAVLDRLGLDRVVRHAGRTRREYRWRVRYLSPRGIEVSEGFKLAYARAFRDAGDLVAYGGDGESDVVAARLAYAVFARSTLLERLRDERPRVYAFETFHDVTAVLEREGPTWSASFSSTTAAEG